MLPEWLGLALPLALVSVLLLRSRAPLGLKGGTVLLLSASAAAAGWYWSTQAARQLESDQQIRTKNPIEGRAGGYVSSARCESCHPQQYETWYRSYHRTMTQVASPQAIRGRFDHVQLELQGKTYLLERRGDEFWVQLEDPEWAAQAAAGSLPSDGLASPPRVWRRVGLLTGSHHMQVYWLPSSNGNQQIVFPFSWLIEDQRWVPFYQTFLRDPNEPPTAHVWNQNCLNCHATAGQPGLDPQTHFTSSHVGELGIACEACHGPAEAHVAANENPVRRYRKHWRHEADPTIVNPKRLSPRLSSEACGQCHGIKWIANRADWQVNGCRFQPGDELDQTTPLVRPMRLQTQPWLAQPLKRMPTFLEDHYWSDGMVRVSGRDFNGLVESPCHLRGNLSCVSCHSMHQSEPSNQLAAGMETNQACLQCHTSMRSRIQEHTHHPVQSSGSLCYNCHMPYTVYGLLKGIRAHQIDSPNVKVTVATGRPNACNLCHLDRSLGWTAKRLSDWYHQAPVELSPDEQSVSAAILALTEGDAGQRALIANAIGWAAARQASGDGWETPFLALLLQDPYSAVRYIAHRSLRRLPGDSNQLPYDFIGPAPEQAHAAQQIIAAWKQGSAKALNRTGPELLIDANGVLDEERIHQMLLHRNNKSMDLQE